MVKLTADERPGIDQYRRILLTAICCNVKLLVYAKGGTGKEKAAIYALESAARQAADIWEIDVVPGYEESEE